MKNRYILLLTSILLCFSLTLCGCKTAKSSNSGSAATTTEETTSTTTETTKSDTTTADRDADEQSTSTELDNATAEFFYGTWKVEKLLCFGLSWNDASEYPTGQDVIGDEIIISKDRFSSVGLKKYEVYQEDFINPVYKIQDKFDDGDDFFRVYKVDIPGVGENDSITVISVYGDSPSKPLAGLFYVVSNERLILMLEAAYFELARVDG